MWILPIIGSVNCDHLLKVMSATFPHCRAATFPLQIIFSGDILRGLKYPIPHQTFTY